MLESLYKSYTEGVGLPRYQTQELNQSNTEVPPNKEAEGININQHLRQSFDGNYLGEELDEK